MVKLKSKKINGKEKKRVSTKKEATGKVFFFLNSQINSTMTFWRWARDKLVPSLYDVKWYNGWKFSYKEGFIGNREAFIVGMPRFRQKRVRRGKRLQIKGNPLQSSAS